MTILPGSQYFQRQALTRSSTNTECLMWFQIGTLLTAPPKAKAARQKTPKQRNTRSDVPPDPAKPSDFQRVRIISSFGREVWEVHQHCKERCLAELPRLIRPLLEQYLFGQHLAEIIVERVLDIQTDDLAEFIRDKEIELRRRRNYGIDGLVS